MAGCCNARDDEEYLGHALDPANGANTFGATFFRDVLTPQYAGALLAAATTGDGGCDKWRATPLLCVPIDAW